MTTNKLPCGFRISADDTLACPHRDVTCCDACAAQYPAIVSVVGVHYWVSDAAERQALRNAVAGMRS